jgi:hypothetical protein
MNQLWDVWQTHYATYAEVLTFGEKQAIRVAAGLTYDAARKMVDEMGFGYCLKPAEPHR